LTPFKALTGGAFDRLNWQYRGEFDQNFSKKSNAPGFARGAWAVLELTGTLISRNESCRRNSSFSNKAAIEMFGMRHSVAMTEFPPYLH